MMNNLILGIVIGLFLYFASQQLLKRAREELKVRKANIKARKAEEEEKADAKVEEMIDRAIKKSKERR